MQKPVLKKKIQTGVHTLPTNSKSLQVNGFIVTHITFEQQLGQYKNLSVTLENGESVLLKWERTDRYGKKHAEEEKWISGTHPLLHPNTKFTGQGLSHRVVEPANDGYVPPQKAPKGFYLWEKWDCAMQKDSVRREVSLKLANNDWWAGYEIYRYVSITLSELESVQTFEEWEALKEERSNAIHKSRCGNPNGTDGWR